jgi:hypothetical protein
MPLLPLRDVATVLRRAARIPVACLLVLALTVAGCGAPEEVAVAGAVPVPIELSEFRLVPQDLRIEPGRRTFEVRNAGTIVHRFELRSEDGSRRLVLGRPLRPGQSETITVQLAPGTYLMRCAQERHNTLGEHGTIDVE